jgi:RNase adaptor protein for sRNA GlmZ degradation
MPNDQDQQVPLALVRLLQEQDQMMYTKFEQIRGDFAKAHTENQLRLQGIEAEAKFLKEAQLVANGSLSTLKVKVRQLEKEKAKASAEVVQEAITHFAQKFGWKGWASLAALFAFFGYDRVLAIVQWAGRMIQHLH